MTTETCTEMRDGVGEESRIMLVDDHTSFRQPLAFMLEREPDLTVVAQAGSLAEAREVLREAHEVGPEVDVAIVDLELPDGFGTEFVAEILEDSPNAQVMVLSAFSDKGTLALAVEAGAAGVLHKSSRIDEITDAIRRLRSGEQLLSQREVIEAVRYVSRTRSEARETQLMVAKLTPRERDVLQALAEGLSDKEIAERLYVGIGTVRSHTTSLLSKLEVQSRLQALVFAVRHGLVEIT
ncbi:MAG: response regulator transcription factor [Actinomycetota bacterium]|nr:response regulator transcription factor [Actinomycetota bacterium]